MRGQQNNCNLMPYEARCDEVCEKDIKDCERFLISLLCQDEEWLAMWVKMWEKYGRPTLKDSIITAIKKIKCFELGIKESSIKVVVPDEEDIAESTVMSFGLANGMLQNQGIYGYLIINPKVYESEDNVSFMLYMLHEFEHVSQYLARERGEKVPKNVCMKYMPDNDFERLWKRVRYASNKCELLANMSAYVTVRTWLDKSGAKEKLSEEEYLKRQNIIEGFMNGAEKQYMLGTIAHIEGCVLLSPYFLCKYLTDINSYKVDKRYDFSFSEDCNKWNEKRGYRTLDKARKYVRKSSNKDFFYDHEKMRLVDSMAVLFATKHKIEPSKFGVVYSMEYGPVSDFVFVDGKDVVEKNRKPVFGFIEVNDKTFALNGNEYFDCLVKAFSELDKDEAFIEAKARWTALERGE